MIRYPDGGFEIDAGTKSPPPKVGDTLSRRGALWKVTGRIDGRPVIIRVEPNGRSAVSRARENVEPMRMDDDKMPPSMLRLRFPDGDVEIRWTTQELPEGVLVRSRGAVWVVKSATADTVVLELAPPEVQAMHGPIVKPTPIGDGDSVLLETIIEV
jgi:hypothetical protein